MEKLATCKEDEYSFKTLFNEYKKEKKITDSMIACNIGFNPRLFRKIQNKNFIPPKLTVLSICVGMGLTTDEIAVLLFSAGYVLSPWSEIDRCYLEILDDLQEKNLVNRINEFNEKLGNRNIQEQYYLGHLHK